MLLNFLYFNFSAIDQPTVIAVLAGQIVVVAVLFLLYQLYRKIPSIFEFFRKQDITGERSVADSKNTTDSDDVNAAIAMALYLHFNKSDKEAKSVVTFRRTPDLYSPWCSKALSMRNLRK